MNKQQFFSNIMTICDWNKIGNDEEVIKPLVTYLSQQSDEEIFSFDDIMTELLYMLDTRKNFKKACEIYNHSDDTFLYSQCVALTNGEEYYEKVKAGKVNEVWEMEFETILYIPSSAWGKKHDSDPANYPHFTSLSYETGSNKNAWK
ncbi:MAG: DUF4240 domain-containing protein [Ruminococcus sp.]|nr:DUF4240 domain-containing protein [Ruminococcus sp.]